ncbi:MAG: hypothetical protein AAFY59_05065 [Pseudomonadota bacterium]
MSDLAGQRGAEDAAAKDAPMTAAAYLDLWERNCVLHCTKGPTVPPPFSARERL